MRRSSRIILCAALALAGCGRADHGKRPVIGVVQVSSLSNMEQALRCGDRTIMMHRGLVVADLSGDERRSVTESDLLMRFSALRYTAEMRVTKELTGAAAM